MSRLILSTACCFGLIDVGLLELRPLIASSRPHFLTFCLAKKWLTRLFEPIPGLLDLGNVEIPDLGQGERLADLGEEPGCPQAIGNQFALDARVAGQRLSLRQCIQYFLARWQFKG